MAEKQTLINRFYYGKRPEDKPYWYPRMRIRGMAANIAAGALAFLIIVAITCTSVDAISRNSCYEQWQGYEARYTWSGGCTVKYDGKWIPDDKINVQDVTVERAAQ